MATQRKGLSKSAQGGFSLSPKQQEMWHLRDTVLYGTVRGTVPILHQTDTIFFARQVPNSDHENDVSMSLALGP